MQHLHKSALTKAFVPSKTFAVRRLPRYAPVPRDDIPHTVASIEGAFKSKVLDTDDKFSFTFNKSGEYTYFCSVHPKMTGKVVVH